MSDSKHDIEVLIEGLKAKIEFLKSTLDSFGGIYKTETEKAILEYEEEIRYFSKYLISLSKKHQ